MRHEQKECVNLKVQGLNTPEYKGYNSKLGVAPVRALDVMIAELIGKDLPTSRNLYPIMSNGRI